MAILTIHSCDNKFDATIYNEAKFTNDDDAMSTFTHNTDTHKFFWTLKDGTVYTQDENANTYQLDDFAQGLKYISLPNVEKLLQAIVDSNDMSEKYELGEQIVAVSDEGLLTLDEALRAIALFSIAFKDDANVWQWLHCLVNNTHLVEIN